RESACRAALRRRRLPSRSVLPWPFRLLVRGRCARARGMATSTVFGRRPGHSVSVARRVAGDPSGRRSGRWMPPWASRARPGCEGAVDPPGGSSDRGQRCSGRDAGKETLILVADATRRARAAGGRHHRIDFRHSVMPAFFLSGCASPRVLAALAVASALCAGQARGDTVILHNGDRLTGRILHMSPSTLTIETTWAGELRIPRYEVSAIETDKPVGVLRERSGRTETVTLTPAAPGQVTLTVEPRGRATLPAPQEGAPVEATADGAAAPPASTVPLARLRYIHPKPEETGEGV